MDTLPPPARPTGHRNISLRRALVGAAIAAGVLVAIAVTGAVLLPQLSALAQLATS